MQTGSHKLGVQIAGLRSGPRGQAKGQDWRVSSSVSPTHSPEQSGAGLSAGAHADLLKLPAVRHRGDHLGQLLLLALQHSVHVLGGHLLGKERREMFVEVWGEQSKRNKECSRGLASTTALLFSYFCTIFYPRQTVQYSRTQGKWVYVWKGSGII